MRFLRPGHGPADTEPSEANRPEETPAAPSSGRTDAMADTQPAEGGRVPARPSEGARILLEKIDIMTSRLQACEQTLERMAQQMSAMQENHAAERSEFEDRLRQQVERLVGHKISDAAAGLEQRQKESLSKQARLLELLAAEISKVRSIAEARSLARDAAAPAGRADPRMHQPRRRSNDADATADMAFLDPEELLAGLSSQEAAPRPEQGREIEFWDWLDQLPREVPDPRASQGIDLDELDRDDHR